MYLITLYPIFIRTQSNTLELLEEEKKNWKRPYDTVFLTRMPILATIVIGCTCNIWVDDRLFAWFYINIVIMLLVNIYVYITYSPRVVNSRFSAVAAQKGISQWHNSVEKDSRRPWYWTTVNLTVGLIQHCNNVTRFLSRPYYQFIAIS